MNLIPKERLETGNYWCTWDTQWNVLKERLPNGAEIPTRDAMCEAFLFGKDGVLNQFDGAREELIVVLDDGWDVPFGAKDPRIFGSLIADSERFPSLKGTQAERLTQLSERVRELGYRGLGLWVPAQSPSVEGGRKVLRTPAEERFYWEERARWCREAGVRYWKVDWGRGAGDADYRRMMTECARRYAPNLKVEHALVRQPLFETESPEQEMQAWRANYLKEVLPQSDFLRTYDVAPEFRYATTLERAAVCLRAAKEIEGDCAVLNVEDTAWIGAALGCSLGVMRHESERGMKKLTYPYRPVSETIGALRWQRMAPPFPANKGSVQISRERLCDEWRYPKRDARLWPCVSDETRQVSAPAAMARNMPLPEVAAAGEKPFVVCSVHPKTQALSVAMLPRTLPERLEITPMAQILVQGATPDAPIGLFGNFGRLTVVYGQLIENRRVWAQNLLTDEAEDVTAQVNLCGNRLTILGELAARLKRAECAETGISGMTLRLI